MFFVIATIKAQIQTFATIFLNICIRESEMCLTLFTEIFSSKISDSGVKFTVLTIEKISGALLELGRFYQQLWSL